MGIPRAPQESSSHAESAAAGGGTDHVRAAGERAGSHGHTPVIHDAAESLRNSQTGFLPLDVVAGVIARAAEPFAQAPPAHQGAVGIVAAGVNGVVGLVGLPFDCVDAQIAVAAQAVQPFLPARPAAMLDIALHLGVVHAHAHPPSMTPAGPMPLPSLGVTQLSGCFSVLINGLPAARAGDVGLSVTCGTFCPGFEIVTGSSQVFIGGSRAACAGDLTIVCNPMTSGLFEGLMFAAGQLGAALSVATNLMDAEHSAAEADAAADGADAAAEAQAAAAAAAGSTLAAVAGGAQIVADGLAMALKQFIGKDPGIPPGIGMVLGGSSNVMIGGLPIPNSLDACRQLLRAVRGLRGRPRRQHPPHRHDAEHGEARRRCGLPGCP